MTELKDVKPLPKPTRARVTAGPRRGAKGTPPKPDAVTPLASSAAPRRAPSEPAKFDKVAYQREYMRNRRAEAKAKLAKKAKKARK